MLNILSPCSASVSEIVASVLGKGICGGAYRAGDGVPVILLQEVGSQVHVCGCEERKFFACEAGSRGAGECPVAGEGDEGR